MTIEFFHRQLSQAQNDPLFGMLNRLQRLEPRRAMATLTEDAAGDWWPWKPQEPTL